MKTRLLLFTMFLGFNVFLFITMIKQGEKLVQKVEQSIEIKERMYYR